MLNYLDELWRVNSRYEWLAALAVTLLVMTLLTLLRDWLGGRDREALRDNPQAAAATPTTPTDPGAVTHQERPLARELFFTLVRSTHGFFLLAIALWAGWSMLEQPALPQGETDGLQLIQKIMTIALLLQMAFWVSQSIELWLARYRTRRLEQDAAAVTMMGMVGFLLKLTLLAVILMMILASMGVPVGPLVTSLGVGGIAVGLAAQNILGDLFGSVSIVMDQPFVIGDFIVVGDKMGTVEKIGLKTTRLRSLTGEELVFSNADLLQSRIHNYKRMQERRVVFSFSVEYDTPSEKLRALPGIVQAIIEAQPDTRFDRANLKTLGSTSLDYEVVYFMGKPDFNLMMRTQEEILIQMLDHLRADGVHFAFPTQTLHVVSDGSDPYTTAARTGAQAAAAGDAKPR